MNPDCGFWQLTVFSAESGEVQKRFAADDVGVYYKLDALKRALAWIERDGLHVRLNYVLRWVL